MPEIALELIDPNPFRDFDLHPIDERQVTRLKGSIGPSGFWSSVVARPAGNRFQLAFGHHRIEAARGLGLEVVPIEVRDLNDALMAIMLASENATQRGTTAAASLDAIAALSRVVTETCMRCDNPEGVGQIWPTLSRDAAESIWGKLRKGEQPGRDCIRVISPEGMYTHHQIDLALGVLRDSGRLGSGPIIFDPRCAKLFKLDSHLSEFRRIVTGDVVRSYLSVEKQFDFAQQILTELGNQELTAIKLRERANVIFYEQLGMPRSAMRGSHDRATDDRIKDALNLLRRGVHGVKQGSAMLRDIFDDGPQLSATANDRLEQYADEIEAALQILRPRRKLRVVKGRDVA